MTMNTQALRCVTLSDFNVENFNALLSNDPEEPSIDVVGTDFGQVRQYLFDEQAACWSDRADCAVVWTRPESIIPSFKRLRNFEAVDVRDALAEVDEFSGQLLLLKGRADTVVIPSWNIPPDENGLGLLDLRHGVGLRSALTRMNLRLAEKLADHPEYFILDAQRWLFAAGQTAYNPKLWAMAKVPFTKRVFEAAVAEVKDALRAMQGRARKLIIVDLDNTLWGGVVGDEGWEGLRIGGHDPLGEAYAGFQHALKAMTNRGILVGIVSKNTEDIALEVWRKHPEMVLGLDDVAGWRINWDDKAANVLALVDELNLGLQSTVFIDDNPFERARVREALPEVLVPEWPESPFRYQQALLAMRCFDSPSLTSEDRKRASMYVAERKRTSTKMEAGSLEQWLQTLELKVEVAPLGDGNLARVVQLLNKTNQMNLRTRRLSEAELIEWVNGADRNLLTFRISDRFGEAGLTGILSIEKRGDEAHVTDFVLSCRVMGRGIEEAMLAVAASEAKKMGAARVVAEYLPTKKNSPCLEVWKRSAFANGASEHVFSWVLGDLYPVPSHVDLLQD